jgi:hypothetical protein
MDDLTAGWKIWELSQQRVNARAKERPPFRFPISGEPVPPKFDIAAAPSAATAMLEAFVMSKQQIRQRDFYRNQRYTRNMRQGWARIAEVNAAKTATKEQQNEGTS